MPETDDMKTCKFRFGDVATDTPTRVESKSGRLLMMYSAKKPRSFEAKPGWLQRIWERIRQGGRNA
jgi:hypothetical protein